MSSMDIEQATTKFLVQLDADGRSSHTTGQYQRHLRLLGKWLVGEAIIRLEDVSHEDVARFLSSDLVKLTATGAPRKPTSANAIRSSLKTFFGYMHKAGYLERDPGQLIRRARCGTPPPKSLSDDEMNSLFKAMDDANGDAAARDRVLFGLLASTGMRLGSALGIRVGEIDLDRGEIYLSVGKGARERVVALPREARKRLSVYMDGMGPDERLFPVCARQVQRRLETWGEKAGLRRRVHPHMLRHSFATRLYAESRDLLLVRDALGHASVVSSQVYARR